MAAHTQKTTLKSTSLSFRWSDPLHHGCKTLHGASPGSAAGCRFCKSRHARAVEGKARDWCWRGSREEDGPPGRRAAASDAAGIPTQPAGHGFPNAHEPATGSPHYYHQRSVLPVWILSASCPDSSNSVFLLSQKRNLVLGKLYFTRLATLVRHIIYLWFFSTNIS